MSVNKPKILASLRQLKEENRLKEFSEYKGIPIEILNKFIDENFVDFVHGHSLEHSLPRFAFGEDWELKANDKDEIHSEPEPALPLWPYEYKYISGMGYVVYRRAFDASKCVFEDGVLAHKVAVVVEENNAKIFCSALNQRTLNRLSYS